MAVNSIVPSLSPARKEARAGRVRGRDAEELQWSVERGILMIRVWSISERWG